MSVMTPSSPNDTGSSSSDDSGSSGSPNTAMIILYSITGIITILFLAIIITGAVRAHRHPERYGPRYARGRPRQSRARGIARAMLETIPIVKFGDEQHPQGRPDSIKGDVEMSLEPEPGTESHPGEHQRNDEMAHVPDASHPTSPPEVPSKEEKRTSAAPSTATPGQPHDTVNFSCPICTDDFVKGQDLRVLPCSHKFHPDCIDPWLVNVSGTCPLCRIDLNPSKGEGQDAQETESPAEPQEQAAEPEAAQPRQPRRLTGYLQSTLNARRMRDATVEERLAALRSVREEAHRESVEGNEEAEERRRTRLSTRLRDRFRIRTRPHDGTDGPAQS